MTNRPTLNLPEASLSIKPGKKFDGVLCLSRQRYVTLTPEEWVRQNFMAYMINSLAYPQHLLSVEVPVMLGQSRQRADIVAYSHTMRPLVIVECKAPIVRLTQAAMNQACRYLSILKARAVVLTNGLEHYCVVLPDGGKPQFVESMPSWEDINYLEDA